jgi:hypothetical protein
MFYFPHKDKSLTTNGSHKITPWSVRAGKERNLFFQSNFSCLRQYEKEFSLNGLIINKRELHRRMGMIVRNMADLGRAVAQADSRWLPTTAAGGRFSPSTSVSPANHSTNFSIIIITRGWHCRVDRIGLHPPPSRIPIKENCNMVHLGIFVIKYICILKQVTC